jgi:hypothetical protein
MGHDKKIPQISQIFSRRVVCVQAGLFSAKPVSKKLGNNTFFVWRAVRSPKWDGKAYCAAFWRIFSSKFARKEESCYTSCLLKNEEITHICEIFALSIKENFNHIVVYIISFSMVELSG